MLRGVCRQYYYCNFYYSLLGIETNSDIIFNKVFAKYCNFYYSLLGIETLQPQKMVLLNLIAISITPY